MYGGIAAKEQRWANLGLRHVEMRTRSNSADQVILLFFDLPLDGTTIANTSEYRSSKYLTVTVFDVITHVRCLLGHIEQWIIPNVQAAASLGEARLGHGEPIVATPP